MFLNEFHVAASPCSSLDLFGCSKDRLLLRRHLQTSVQWLQFLALLPACAIARMLFWTSRETGDPSGDNLAQRMAGSGDRSRTSQQHVFLLLHRMLGAGSNQGCGGLELHRHSFCEGLISGCLVPGFCQLHTLGKVFLFPRCMVETKGRAAVYNTDCLLNAKMAFVSVRGPCSRHPGAFQPQGLSNDGLSNDGLPKSFICP